MSDKLIDGSALILLKEEWKKYSGDDYPKAGSIMNIAYVTKDVNEKIRLILENDDHTLAVKLAGECLQYRSMLTRDRQKRIRTDITAKAYNESIDMLSHMCDDLQTYYGDVPEEIRELKTPFTVELPYYKF